MKLKKDINLVKIKENEFWYLGDSGWVLPVSLINENDYRYKFFYLYKNELFSIGFEKRSAVSEWLIKKGILE